VERDFSFALSICTNQKRNHLQHNLLVVSSEWIETFLIIYYICGNYRVYKLNINTMAKLQRSYNKRIGGVCAGIAEYFGWSVSTVRLITLILILFGGISIWVYLILWIIMPSANNYIDY